MTERLLFADSQNRDVTLYPDGNSYILHLTRPLRNVERVELVSARLPNTMYNLTDGSNVLTLNGTSNVSLNSGFYSAYTLAAAVTAATSNVPALNYLVSEGHYLFTNPTSFSIKIRSKELGTMLGMAPGVDLTAALAPVTDPTYSGLYVLRSSTLVDFSLNDYVFLDIDELKTPFNIDTGAIQGTTGTISGSNANRAFAPIIMDVGSACIKNFHENKDYSISVVYPEPINSLQRLTVRWIDRDGNLLDFRGWNTNAFVLRVYIASDPKPTLPPPEPLEQIEIKRIVEAMKVMPPPPPEPGIRKRIPWWIIILVLLVGIVVWKSLPPAAQRVTANMG